MFGITPFRGIPRSLSRRWGWDFDKIFDTILEEFDDKTFSYDPMKVDIKERDKEYVLEAELPGTNKDNINLEIRDDILTISVEREEEFNEERENYIRRERRFGSFKRSFYVDDVDQEKVKAKFENGILKVRLPKKEGTSSKKNRIPIE
ncbi:Hsp20/alpha crystallin family protein [Schnuerera sp.]|uniref:Hsp20/alpha crystallin family protein n=1 Tax=Schnuerera sp. TaxID=2794844 RepID=UPI002C1E2BDC|nr:Hsp20/alpha crystallin family protein [Schnuerera sp.]HSH35457.1 Hsp20/alpha crystallin family protein [Schnuerera sp.]